MKIVVTGATGHIGTHFTALAVNRGYDIVEASRRQPTSQITSWLHFDLVSNENIVLPVDTNAVVHLAANTLATNLSDDGVELAAAQKLIKAAQDVGARFIFVSSQTAHTDAPTRYGRIKWHIEQAVLTSGGWVVRPGHVYGGALRGAYGTLVNTIQKLPLLPAFIPSPKVQPIHVDDLAEGLLRLAENNDAPNGLYCLADPTSISFSCFLKEIAHSRLRSDRISVPIPIAAINFFSKIMSPTGQNKLNLNCLQSLFDLPEMTTKTDLDKLGLTLRSLPTGLHPSGDDRRRRLLREGQALLKYILKKQPDNTMLRRYVRAIEKLCTDQALDLPNTFLNYPILFSLIDKASPLPGATDTVKMRFTWRLDAATIIAEASPAGAARFLELRPKYRRLNSFLSLARSLAGEVFWRLAGLLASPWLRSIMTQNGTRHDH